MPPDRKARDDDTIQPRGKKKSGVRGPPKFLIFRSKPAIDADRVASQTVPPRPSDRRESAAASPPASKGDGRKLRQQRGDPKVATPPRVPTPRVDPRSKDDLDAARRAARDAKATRGDTVGGKARGGGRGRGGEGGRGKGTAGGGLASGSSSNEPSTLESSPSKEPRSTSPPDPSAAASASSAAALRRQLEQERAERFRAEELAEQMRAQVQVLLHDKAALSTRCSDLAREGEVREDILDRASQALDEAEDELERLRGEGGRGVGDDDGYKSL